LAEHFGWGPSGQTLISRLEKGSTKTDADKLKTILDFLNIEQDAEDGQEIEDLVKNL